MTLRRLDAVGVVLSLIGRVRDPRERLIALVAVRAEVRDHGELLAAEIRSTIVELRSADVPLLEIAAILKVSTQRAHQLANEKPTTTTGEISDATHR